MSFFNPKTATKVERDAYVATHPELVAAIVAAEPKDTRPRWKDGTLRDPRDIFDAERFNAEQSYNEACRRPGPNGEPSLWKQALAAEAEEAATKKAIEDRKQFEADVARNLEARELRQMETDRTAELREERRLQGVFGPSKKDTSK